VPRHLNETRRWALRAGAPWRIFHCAPVPLPNVHRSPAAGAAMHTGGKGTHSADRVPSVDTMRITAGCVFRASSGTAGGASIAGGRRRSWSSSGASAWVRRPRTRCLRSFATDTTAASGTCMRIIRCPSSSGRICGSISTTSGRDAIDVTWRRLSGIAPEGGGPGLIFKLRFESATLAYPRAKIPRF
jgi:hypothetical protein